MYLRNYIKQSHLQYCFELLRLRKNHKGVYEFVFQNRNMVEALPKLKTEREQLFGLKITIIYCN